MESCYNQKIHPCQLKTAQQPKVKAGKNTGQHYRRKTQPATI